VRGTRGGRNLHHHLVHHLRKLSGKDDENVPSELSLPAISARSRRGTLGSPVVASTPTGGMPFPTLDYTAVCLGCKRGFPLIAKW